MAEEQTTAAADRFDPVDIVAKLKFRMINHALPLWSKEGWDQTTGGFVERLDQKGCADLGYTREEILSLTLRDIDPTMDHDECVKAITQLKESGTLVKEGVHLRKNGSTFPVEVSTKLIRLEGREFVVAMVRDITERSELRKDFGNMKK